VEGKKNEMEIGGDSEEKELVKGREV